MVLSIVRQMNELQAKFEEFKKEAIENMLDYCPLGARLKTEQTIAIVSKAMQFKKFDLMHDQTLDLSRYIQCPLILYMI